MNRVFSRNPKLHVCPSVAHAPERFSIALYIRQYQLGHAVAQLVETLRYKPDSEWCQLNLSSSRIMALGLNQPLTAMRTRNIS